MNRNEPFGAWPGEKPVLDIIIILRAGGAHWRFIAEHLNTIAYQRRNRKAWTAAAVQGVHTTWRRNELS